MLERLAFFRISFELLVYGGLRTAGQMCVHRCVFDVGKCLPSVWGWLVGLFVRVHMLLTVCKPGNLHPDFSHYAVLFIDKCGGGNFRSGPGSK